MRKAKNKVSGHMRAIKILKKSKFSEEKKKALLDEAKILRALVKRKERESVSTRVFYQEYFH